MASEAAKAVFAAMGVRRFRHRDGFAGGTTDYVEYRNSGECIAVARDGQRTPIPKDSMPLGLALKWVEEGFWLEMHD